MLVLKEVRMSGHFIQFSFPTRCLELLLARSLPGIINILSHENETEEKA
jgi:hypothetical protein